MPLINCETSLQLKWHANCFLVTGAVAGQVPKFTTTDTKFYVPVVFLSTQDNAKLLEQLKPGFEEAINWNKYQSKVILQARNSYLDYFIDPSFQEVNILFVLSFENENDRESYKRYFLLTVEIKDYNVLKVGRNIFDQPIKNNSRTCDNIRKISIGQDDDCTTGCLLGYPYFEKYYKLIAIDLSKQQKDTTMFFIIEEAKEIFSDFL